MTAARLRDRLALLGSHRLLIVQLCVSASVAWLVATELIGHKQPFFAPIAAVVSLAGGVGHRRRAVVELVVGVAMGIGIGELLISVIGRGTWQLALVVGIAAVVSVSSGLGRMALLQAVNSAILLTAVVPAAGATGIPALNRFVDALVGGLVGLVVLALLPSNPVRDLERGADRVLMTLAGLLDTLAVGVRWGDAGPAWTALQEARALQPEIEALSGTLTSANEVSRVSPLRWRQRGHVHLYGSTWQYIDYAVRDARVLSRRVETMLRRGVAVPDGFEGAVTDLAGAVRIFASRLSKRDRFDEDVVQLLVDIAHVATTGLRDDAPLSAVAAVAQVRAMAADLLFATGLTALDVDELFARTTKPANDDPDGG